ncbi:MAG: ABC transporter ATP-binding protein, partial [bacterium]|nr:ABC transporter ATP-binding protein [bacterium]
MILENNPVIYLWRKTWKYSKGNRKHVVLYIILFTFANAVNFFEPLLVGAVLNEIQTQGITKESLPNLLIWLFLFFVITLAFWIFHGPARIMENRNAFLVKANYKRYLLDGTMALPAQWHTDHHSGDTIDKIEKGTEALKEFSSDTFIIIESIIRLVGSYLALAYFNLYSGFIVLFMVFVTISLIIRFDKILIPKWGQLNSFDNNVSERVFDVLSNITTVIIFRVEQLVSKSIVKKMMTPFRLFVSTNELEESKWFFVSVLSSIMTIAVLGSYFYMSVRSGNVILIGTVYALYGYINRIDGLFFRFAYKYGEIVRQRTRVQNAEIVSDNFVVRQKNKQISLADYWDQIDVSNLSFSYHTQEGADLHLDNISFSIRRGQRIAFIGASGSGKTTTLRVIRELYQPQSIAVSIDGQEIEGGFKRISSNIS